MLREANSLLSLQGKLNTCVGHRTLIFIAGKLTSRDLQSPEIYIIIASQLSLSWRRRLVTYASI